MRINLKYFLSYVLKIFYSLGILWNVFWTYSPSTSPLSTSSSSHSFPLNFEISSFILGFSSFSLYCPDGLRIVVCSGVCSYLPVITFKSFEFVFLAITLRWQCILEQYKSNIIIKYFIYFHCYNNVLKEKNSIF